MLRADPEFRDKPAVRDAALAKLRADILAAPVDRPFQDAAQGEAGDRLPRPDDALPQQHQRRGPRRLPVRGLLRLAHRRPDELGRRRSRPATPTATRTAACSRPIRKTWATVWKFRTFEEREYHSIDHTSGRDGAARAPQLRAGRGERRRGDREPVRSVGPGPRPLHQRPVRRRRRGRRTRRPGSRATRSSISSPIPGSRSSTSRTRT